MEENEATPSKDPHCKTMKITRDTKLSGAKLTDMGEVDRLETCIAHCCRKDSCDVAYMEEQKCYTVQCQDGLQCQSFRKPADKDKNTYIAYMRRTVDDAEKERGNCKIALIIHKENFKKSMFNEVLYPHIQNFSDLQKIFLDFLSLKCSVNYHDISNIHLIVKLSHCPDWVIVYVIVGSLVCASGLSGIIWASCICIKR